MRHFKMTRSLTIVLLFISFTLLSCTRKSYYKCGLYISSTSSFRQKIDSKILKLERTAIADTTMVFISGTIHGKDSLDGNVKTHLLAYANILVTDQMTGKTFSKSTDFNGKYNFYIPSSTYNLTVKTVTYNSLIIQNVKFGSGDIIEFNALLGQSDQIRDSTVYSTQADKTFKLISSRLSQTKKK